MKYALVFWLKPKRGKTQCSVIETSYLNSTSDGTPDIGDIVEIEYGTNKYSARILSFSEDFEFLNKLEVTGEGNIMVEPKKKGKKQTKRKQRAENPKASDVDEKKKSTKRNQQKRRVQEKSQLRIDSDSNAESENEDDEKENSKNGNRKQNVAESSQFSNGQDVSEEGEIVNRAKKMEKKLVQIEQKAKNLEACEVDRKKRSKKGKQPEENVEEDFQFLNGLEVTEQGETKGGLEEIEKKHKEVEHKAENREASDVDEKEKSKKRKKQKKSVEGKSQLFKDSDSNTEIENAVTQKENSRKGKRQKENVEEGQPLPGCSAVDSLTKIVSTVVDNFEDQSSSSPRPSTSKSGSGGLVDQLVEQILGKLRENEEFKKLGVQSRSSSKSSKHHKKYSRDDTSPKRVELVEQSGVYIDQQERKLIKRWDHKPNEMIRRLMLHLVGAEQLKKMTARGKITCPNRKGLKMESIPENILKAVKEFIDIHGVYKMTPAQYHKVINQQCHNLRNPKKPTGSSVQCQADDSPSVQRQADDSSSDSTSSAD